MFKNFTLEYWIEDEWFIGKLKELPAVFSQGKTLDELKENIREAYELMVPDEEVLVFRIRRRRKKEVEAQ